MKATLSLFVIGKDIVTRVVDMISATVLVLAVKFERSQWYRMRWSCYRLAEVLSLSRYSQNFTQDIDEALEVGGRFWYLASAKTGTSPTAKY